MNMEHTGGDAFSGLNSQKALPYVKTPGWRVEYDEVLGHRYINDQTGQVQYDSPDEVMMMADSHIVSDHRNVFSTALKRSLSPKFLSGGGSRSPSPSPTSTTPVTPVNEDQQQLPFKPKTKKRTSSIFTFGNSHYKEKHTLDDVKDKPDSDDDDVEEFKRQLELEMLDYENQRIQRNSH